MAAGLLLIALALLIACVGFVAVIFWTVRTWTRPREPHHDPAATYMAPTLSDVLRGPSPCHGDRWTRPETYLDSPEYVDRKNPEA